MECSSKGLFQSYSTSARGVISTIFTLISSITTPTMQDSNIEDNLIEDALCFIIETYLQEVLEENISTSKPRKSRNSRGV